MISSCNSSNNSASYYETQLNENCISPKDLMSELNKKERDSECLSEIASLCQDPDWFYKDLLSYSTEAWQIEALSNGILKNKYVKKNWKPSDLVQLYNDQAEEDSSLKEAYVKAADKIKIVWSATNHSTKIETQSACFDQGNYNHFLKNHIGQRKALFTEEDLDLLAKSNFCLRHVTGLEQANSEICGKISGDALAISCLEAFDKTNTQNFLKQVEQELIKFIYHCIFNFDVKLDPNSTSWKTEWESQLLEKPCFLLIKTGTKRESYDTGYYYQFGKLGRNSLLHHAEVKATIFPDAYKEIIDRINKSCTNPEESIVKISEEVIKHCLKTIRDQLHSK